jgi:hypothetical protein
MFCSACGVQLDSALNFCNRCGAPVSKGDSASVAQTLLQGLPYVGGFGLIGFVVLCGVLLRRDIPMEAFVLVAAFYLAALVAICWLLIKHSSQLGRLQNEGRPSGNFAEPLYLNPRTTAQLEESRQEPASVVDNTTRSLDEISIKR